MGKKEFLENTSKILAALLEGVEEDLEKYLPDEGFSPEEGCVTLQEKLLTLVLIIYAGAFLPEGDKEFLESFKDRAKEILKTIRKEMDPNAQLILMGRNQPVKNLPSKSP